MFVKKLSVPEFTLLLVKTLLLGC